MGFFDKLKKGLTKTKKAFVSGIDSIFGSYEEVGEDLFDDLEELLVCSDIGAETAMEILDRLRDRIYEDRITIPNVAKIELFDILSDMIGECEPIKYEKGKMTVILVIGVNGVGKTTSIAKMAYDIKKNGKKVLLAAADTFRAAAIDQLSVWADRAGVDLIAQSEGSDPAAVVFDAAAAAKKRGTDALNSDLLLFACSFVFSRYVKDTVCVNVKSYLNLWNATWSWGNSVQVETADSLVIFSHWSLTLKNVDLY